MPDYCGLRIYQNALGNSATQVVKCGDKFSCRMPHNGDLRHPLALSPATLRP